MADPVNDFSGYVRGKLESILYELGEMRGDIKELRAEMKATDIENVRDITALKTKMALLGVLAGMISGGISAIVVSLLLSVFKS